MNPGTGGWGIMRHAPGWIAMQKLTYRSTVVRIRGMGGPRRVALLAAALVVIAGATAPAQTAQTMARVVTQANDGGNASLRGCIRIDIDVDPTSPVGVPIRDLHLLVAVSRHSQQGDATLQG